MSGLQRSAHVSWERCTTTQHSRLASVTCPMNWSRAMRVTAPNLGRPAARCRCLRRSCLRWLMPLILGLYNILLTEARTVMCKHARGHACACHTGPCWFCPSALVLLTQKTGPGP